VAETLAHSHAGEPAANRRISYGLIAEFDDAHHIIGAAATAREAGYRRMDAYTPFPVEGLSEALGHKDIHVPLIMLAGGILGALAGFGLIYYTMVLDYPLNIGGRPLELHHTWATFIPITFELTVLTSAMLGIVGMFALNGLPQPYHPVFDAPNFDRASSDRFFLCIEAQDPRFDIVETRSFLESLGASNVSEIELRK